MGCMAWGNPMDGKTINVERHLNYVLFLRDFPKLPVGLSYLIFGFFELCIKTYVLF